MQVSFGINYFLSLSILHLDSHNYPASFIRRTKSQHPLKFQWNSPKTVYTKPGTSTQRREWVCTQPFQHTNHQPGRDKLPRTGVFQEGRDSPESLWLCSCHHLPAEHISLEKMIPAAPLTWGRTALPGTAPWRGWGLTLVPFIRT